jgi:hypothetical protein
MIWFFGILAVVVVFVIAAVAIGRETHRLDAVTPVPSIDVNDAVGWISERLPEDISAQVSYEDVRDILLWHLDEMQSRGVASTLDSGADSPDQDSDENPIVVDDDWGVDAVGMRALQTGRDLNPLHIRAVLDAELEYFNAIGAVGPQALDPQAPDQP